MLIIFIDFVERLVNKSRVKSGEIFIYLKFSYTISQSLLQYKAMNVERQHHIFIELWFD